MQSYLSTLFTSGRALLNCEPRCLFYVFLVIKVVFIINFILFGACESRNYLYFMESPRIDSDWPVTAALRIPVEDWNMVFEIQRRYIELQAKYSPRVLLGMLKLVNQQRK